MPLGSRCVARKYSVRQVCAQFLLLDTYEYKRLGTIAGQVLALSDYSKPLFKKPKMQRELRKPICSYPVEPKSLMNKEKCPIDKTDNAKIVLEIRNPSL